MNSSPDLMRPGPVLRKNKHVLERRIADAIMEFQDATGVAVTDVRVEMLDVRRAGDEGATTLIGPVRVEIEL